MAWAERCGRVPGSLVWIDARAEGKVLGGVAALDGGSYKLDDSLGFAALAR